MAPRLGIGVKVVKVFKLWPKNFVGIDFLGKNLLGMYIVYNCCVYPFFFWPHVSSWWVFPHPSEKYARQIG